MTHKTDYEQGNFQATLTLTSPKLETLENAIATREGAVPIVRAKAEAEVARLQEAIKEVEREAQKDIDRLHLEMGDFRGQRHAEFTRLVDEHRTAQVLEANRLLGDEPISQPDFEARVAEAVRGKHAEAWAENIVFELEYRQQFGGLAEWSLDNLENDDGRRLTAKQVKRVWDVMLEHCPLRGEDNYDRVMLGTPYPVYRTEGGAVMPR